MKPQPVIAAMYFALAVPILLFGTLTTHGDFGSAMMGALAGTFLTLGTIEAGRVALHRRRARKGTAR